MQATRTRLHQWIERGLAEANHPPLADIVKQARAQTPPVGWARLAADVSRRCGEEVSLETLRQWFGTADTDATGTAA